MKKFKLIHNSTSIMRDDGAVIPADPSNRDYIEYEAWVLAGNIADPADPDLVPSLSQVRQGNSKAEAALAVEFKSITASQAVDYVDTNVTSLASAKEVLKTMVRMLIALRDNNWPDLPES